MTTGNQSSRGPQAARASEPNGKKPYRKPAFRHERVFETMALSCGKAFSTQANCRGNRKLS
jgi:hypothetical protein